jgi:hypothetical protein
VGGQLWEFSNKWWVSMYKTKEIDLVIHDKLILINYTAYPHHNSNSATIPNLTIYNMLRTLKINGILASTLLHITLQKFNALIIVNKS